MKKTILLTGGTGYIGSHTAVELIGSGYEAVLLDNLSNSKAVVVERIRQISGTAPALVEGDINDRVVLRQVFEEYDIEGVIHFAGLKAVGESNDIPLHYYRNNISGTVTLLEEMDRAGVRNIVFSSSATVYGDPESVPITEEAPLQATNPYGRTKLFIEHILKDLSASDPAWNIAILRYFNPIGAHESGLIGENPKGIPNNLLPFVAQVAAGQRESLRVFGDDYPTPDGTGIRDYIHVVDLAKAHVKACRALEVRPGLIITNLGTGKGYSVLEVVRAFEKASGRKVPFTVAPRRPGDVSEAYADPRHASKVLGWQAELDLDRMCVDGWRFICNISD
ncbi:MAG: UDP-glucose 4-epimerase GalE [Balneolales bacterium]